MDQFDIVFRNFTEADCFTLNEWFVVYEWDEDIRTLEAIKLDPFGWMKFATTIAAENSKTGILLGIVTYILPRPNFGHIALYMVNPSCKGIGVGKILFDKALEAIGDRNIGINSSPDMTYKYRERSGFKIVGDIVFRYLVPKSQLLAKFNTFVDNNNLRIPIIINEVATNEDKEKIIKFMQKAENRVERYVEDDLTLNYMAMPTQHTILASDSEGNTCGWATIGLNDQSVEKISPVHAVNNEVFVRLIVELLGKYETQPATKVMITVSELKPFAIDLVKSLPNADMIVQIDQSFTRYKEYPNGYLSSFYCW